MVVTRRSQETETATQTSNIGSSVALLERKPVNNYVSQPVQEESYEEQQERMQKNLEKLLNYDRYAEQNMAESQVIEETVVDSSISAPVAQEEDIRPTSTTMQFGDGDIDQMYKEMAHAKKREKEYSLNAKGKFVIALYSLAVTIILALIVLNTGILASLSDIKEAKAQTLSRLQSERYALQQQIEEVSSTENVIKTAEDVLGMIKG